MKRLSLWSSIYCTFLKKYVFMSKNITSYVKLCGEFRHSGRLYPLLFVKIMVI